MIEKINNDINNDIKELKQKIEDNEIDMSQFFGLLDTINKQVAEVQKNIEMLQLENESYNKEIKRLEIVKEYLEEHKRVEKNAEELRRN